MRGRGRALFLAILLLALAACGLEILPDLDPPGDSIKASPSTAVFTILNQATLIAEFRGFEVYYKFIDSGQPIQDNLSTKLELEQAGFQRMYAPGVPVLAYPLIPVDPADHNTDFPIELDFTVVGIAAPSADYQGANPPAGNPIPIRRAATDGFVTKSFQQSELAQADSDLAGVTWPPAPNLDLVAYALAYGLKDLTDHLYSTARYLGYMTYYF